MWNHAQNSLQSGDDACETNPSELKDRIEKSFDLTQYLKYLDHLFNQSTSESESSDSEEDERSQRRIFTDFVQPPAQTLPPPPYNHQHLIVGSSNVSENSHLPTLKSENFHLEANISSSSLSSIDSGTSSLSLNLSTETFVETTLAKAEEAVSAIPLQENNSSGSPNFFTDSGNTLPVEDVKPDVNNIEKDKKTQKKKKANRATDITVPRQNKPSSGGKGNNGPKGSGGGGGTSGSTNNSSSSGSANESGQTSNNSGSTGTKRHSQSNEHDTLQPCDASELNSSFYLQQNMDDESHVSDFMLSNSDNLLLNESIADDFTHDLLGGTTEESNETFESHGLNAFPITALLDMEDDEGSLSDYISMTTPASMQSTSVSSSPLSHSSTNFFTKIAISAASTALSNSSRNLNNSKSQTKTSGSKNNGKKRKATGLQEKGCSEKYPKLSEKEKQSKIKFLNAKRKKVYVGICRKEIGKTHRNRISSIKESLSMKKKLANACARHLRKEAVQSQKCMKESVCVAKRLTLEMESYYKNLERAERDLKRREEKKMEEKQKNHMNLVRAKLEERKLNQIVTQLELFGLTLRTSYLDNVNETDQQSQTILQNLNEMKDETSLASSDSFDSEQAKALVKLSVDGALREHQQLIKALDKSGLYSSDVKSIISNKHVSGTSQPSMFEGILKRHQIRKMNWLTRMFHHGLNAIVHNTSQLDDCAELVAFITDLAEAFGIWGPFLIVAPDTLLEKWHSLILDLTPNFKVIPYWGKPMERKIRRQFWDNDNLHNTKEAEFHVVLTSYQVMEADLKYIGKVKWQYLIVDDRENCIMSAKWTPLLGFSCRTKLLLSSELQLISMSQICSYLYFLMPSLFDSQEEISEWLLKELEAPAVRNKKNSVTEDEKILERLRAVVKSFTFDESRENLQGDGLRDMDIKLFCSPSRRQLQVYSDVLEQADLGKISEKLETCLPCEAQNRIQQVLKLSTELMKICNHPDLVEVNKTFRSPFWMESIVKQLPKLIYQDGLVLFESSRNEWVSRLVPIFDAFNVYSSMYSPQADNVNSNKRDNICTWDFIRMLNLSPSELEVLFKSSCARLNHLVNFQSVLEKICFEAVWKTNRNRISLLELVVSTKENFLFHLLSESPVLSNLVFIPYSCTLENYIVSMPKPIQYRKLKSKIAFARVQKPLLASTLEETGKLNHHSLPLNIPKFLYCFTEKALSEGVKPTVASWRINDKLKILENRILLSQIMENDKFEGYIDVNNNKKTIASIFQNLFFAQKPRVMGCGDLAELILGSGKLQRLDRLLEDLNGRERRILLCSYIEDTVELLKHYLELKRLKYSVVGEEIDVLGDENASIVYLLNGRRSSFTLPESISTVVFVDQDWSSKLEDQKQNVINKLDESSEINCYRLICKGTIEERILKLVQEKRAPSFVFSNDAMQNLNGSTVPSLKSLISALIGGIPQKDGGLVDSYKYKVRIMTDDSTSEKHHKSFKLDGKDSKGGLVFKDGNDNSKSFGAFNGNRGQILDLPNRNRHVKSPCCSEEMETDQNERFGFNLDEGYMGMSPESVENISVKSDCEEDNGIGFKHGRGSGKRGRPCKRRVLPRLDLDDGHMRRSPGRPRKIVGLVNQGLRGRRPGRPPLAKFLPPSSTLTTINSSPFGFYSSPDLELS